MDATAMRQRLQEAPVARLATIDASGKPHIVPITFVLDGEVLHFAVDAKPKRTRDLQRLRNIAANARVSVLVDHYDDDWSQLWWVRIDGAAQVIGDSALAEHAIDLLARKYTQYEGNRPQGPVVTIRIEHMSGWKPG
jgi:PPOX class probable F420-dependent enzyme